MMFLVKVEATVIIVSISKGNDLDSGEVITEIFMFGDHKEKLSMLPLSYYEGLNN